MTAATFAVADVPAGDLRVVAVTDRGLGNTSWLVDLGGHEALVVDPERDPLPYLRVAERLDLEITHAAETHLHADFVTGARELAASGAGVLCARDAGVTWPHRAVDAGEELAMGRWTLRVLATPGHTPEHVSYLLLDDDRPRAVFTGGSLLVGAVARTDLIDPRRTESLTRALWRSLRDELLRLPDDVLVLPTHGAGSFCSAGGSSARWTTIGEERSSNPLLQAADEDDFVAVVVAGFGSYPPYFLRLRHVNRAGPRLFGRDRPALPRLTIDELEQALGAGAVLVDARDIEAIGAGHVPGSVANTLRPDFSSWLGWLVTDPATPLVFVLDDEQDRGELVRQCLTIGYENLLGELDGGIGAWQAAGRPVARVPVVDPATAGERAVVDVRQRAQFAAGHVRHALNVELGDLPGRLADLPDRPVLLMCGHGERAMTAATLLERAGRDDVAVLAGGPGDWADACSEPVEHG